MSTQPSPDDAAVGTSVPVARLSLSYFLYFSILGALVPFLGRYLRAYGFGFDQISQVAAVLSLAMSIGPFLWASLSDRTGKRMLFARLSALFLVLIGIVFGLSSQPLWQVVCVGLFGLFLSSAVPQLESVTLEYLGPSSTRYGNIRLWGTLGFAAMVILLGPLLSGDAARLLPWAMVLIAASALVSFMFLQDVPVTNPGPRDQVEWSAFFGRLKRSPVWGLYAALFLWNVSLAAYNTFFDLYLQDVGYGGLAIGGYLALAPVAEVGLFVILSRLLTRWGAVTVLVVALLGTAVRWLMTAWVADIWWLLAVAQVGHALTYGAMHGSSMYLLSRLFPNNQQARAQALYLAFSTGFGLVAGNLLAGQLWDLPGGPQWVFSLNALLCLVSVALILSTMRGQRIRQLLSH